ncbi:MAG: DUF4330 domain-containing protein [Clostridia bacterium]|nr:DUF4330 domain-containing protein [Clostridia bacterium]
MKKIRFTVIDALILLVVIAVLVFGIKFVTQNNTSAGETKEVYFTVLASNVDEGTGSIIKEGDEVSISFSEQAFATVVGVSEEPYKESKFLEAKGFYTTHEVEGKSDLKILLRCPADISDTRIANGEVPIRVGGEMPVRGKGYTVKGYVIELEDK